MLFGLFPLIHVGLGMAMLNGSMGFEELESGSPPDMIGWVFIGVASFIILIMQCNGICLICSGRSLAQQKRYMFSMIMACFLCLSFPFGTALGVFTLIVLNRESVKQGYEARKGGNASLTASFPPPPPPLS